jgi:hypothetical protein
MSEVKNKKQSQDVFIRKRNKSVLLEKASEGNGDDKVGTNTRYS